MSDPIYDHYQKEEKVINDLTFDHVTFGYLPDQPILKDYSFKVAKGEHVTFVGRTGKGKSTIFKLLLGPYQP
ncbi:hypothetical protein ME790_13640 [Lactobacillus delbrueckii]|uniref:ATP-binding cassette domain-containing protein n=1 Tax=Lactobacillus delbrueckii TaxID=1584 RepID=UPI00208148DD|nr:ATP-binding cassette domain-containing protein [Lactobacillus delbrueckii]GHN32293.1 hypothetical protein ME790_13640 [Lactobacillus delbrueckii]